MNELRTVDKKRHGDQYGKTISYHLSEPTSRTTIDRFEL